MIDRNISNFRVKKYKFYSWWINSSSNLHFYISRDFRLGVQRREILLRDKEKYICSNDWTKANKCRRKIFHRVFDRFEISTIKIFDSSMQLFLWRKKKLFTFLNSLDPLTFEQWYTRGTINRSFPNKKRQTLATNIDFVLERVDRFGKGHENPFDVYSRG